MQNPKRPPLQIELPPTIIKPEQPSPHPPLSTQSPGYISRPLPWSGTVVDISEIQNFFKKKNIKSESLTMAVVVTIATQQDNLEKSYNSYIGLLKAKLDHEIGMAIGVGKGIHVLEKEAIDQLIAHKRSELQSNLAAAATFFARDPLHKSIKKNAVDFVNILQGSREPSTDIYNRWLRSITAAYTAKVLTEEIRILNEKLQAMTSARATIDAAKQKNFQERIDTLSNQQGFTHSFASGQQSLNPSITTNRHNDVVLSMETRNDLEEIFNAHPPQPYKSNIEERIRFDHLPSSPHSTHLPESPTRQHIDVLTREINNHQARVPWLHAGRLNRESDLAKANQFHIAGAVATARPMIVTSAGTIAAVEGAALDLGRAIQLALASLADVLAGTASGFFVGVAALIYSPKLANGELPQRFYFSTPLSDLAPLQDSDLQIIPTTDQTIDLPVRLSSRDTVDGQSELLVIKAEGIPNLPKVRVVAATYDAQQNIYTATVGNSPSTTLTWTPVVVPGNGSTTLPTEPPSPLIHTGASVTPVEGRIDSFPEIAESSFDDYVFVFPIDSGLPPLYVMFRDRREDPGVSWGIGAPVFGIWLDAASQGEGAPIPLQIARKLRGKEFRSFKKFRESFWKAVADDPSLSRQFNRHNLKRMKRGLAAFPNKPERVGGRIRYELHHKQYISHGGEVYHIDNIYVMTPKRHIETHKEQK
ncbi:DNase/tRNase domain of colicin-like bacteriocin [Pseudomonas sp. NFACC15-1]|uniref:S-type pyocin domain-containing protein n=1 Tax=unclassified Pseudomonas TaxID=196821 RepID=UPI000882CDEF|nr:MULTISPECIES: S-type pyocin domain-containing protein [unclassified Pseudomonas]SDA90155.1 DNase/tRNase domain of colicin-like bacteriocin [Pseudomonas sp. NFACC15-1]SDY97526.1 DNase/tRNase domain of colicin-like bacteriocin [Pseudomonas sp. NFACC14]